MQKYFHQKGRTHSEALKKISEKYGENYRILTQKNVPAPGLKGLFGQEYVEYSGYVCEAKEVQQMQISRDAENRAAILAAVGRDVPPALPTKKAQEEDVMDEVLKELRDLKGQLALGASTPPPEPFTLLSELTEILQENDFDSVYIEKMIQNLREKFTAVELEDRGRIHQEVAHCIAGDLRFCESDRLNEARVFVLIGPTGVGKTTTIAKLAAVFGYSKHSGNVQIITVDNYRIGAKEQVESYGGIMGIPVSTILDYKSLKAQIALAADEDHIFVDTIGNSPRDGMKIEEMRALLQACGDDADIHLALSATTKSTDLREIIRKFDSFNFKSVLITKLDETSKIGNIISVLSENDKSISYLTDGQSVPVDIAIASPNRLLRLIKGLEYESRFIEKSNTLADLTAEWR